MKQYLESLQRIVNIGLSLPDRTKVGRVKVFGTQERYDLKNSFPLVTTRQIFTKGMINETLWFIRGETNVKTMGGTKIWDNWAVREEDVTSYVGDMVKDETDVPEGYKEQLAIHLQDEIGNIGPMYGAMWRNAPITETRSYPHRTLDQLPSDKLKIYTEEYEELMVLSKPEYPLTLEQFANRRYWQSIDQLNELLINLRERPYSSRHCITAWIPEYVPDETKSPQANVLDGKGALSACHAFFQFMVLGGQEPGDRKRLSCQLYIRSSDAAIGKPTNIAQYALLTKMIAQVVDMDADELIFTSGDSHIYTNHLEANGAKEGIETQLQREPLPPPTLWLNPEVKDLFKFTPEDIRIENYQYHPRIDYPIAV